MKISVQKFTIIKNHIKVAISNKTQYWVVCQLCCNFINYKIKQDPVLRLVSSLPHIHHTKTIPIAKQSDSENLCLAISYLYQDRFIWESLTLIKKNWGWKNVSTYHGHSVKWALKTRKKQFFIDFGGQTMENIKNQKIVFDYISEPYLTV